MLTKRNLKDFFNELKMEDDFFGRLVQFIGDGDTLVQQNRVIETMTVDDSWIRTIQEALLAIERIVKDPKKSIVDLHEVVPTEKAKRTGPETVRHLASHTGYIRAIEDDGFIQPSKLLVKYLDEDLAIYENRFVVTLINNLTYFVEQRYLAIKDHIDTQDITQLKVNSKFLMKKGDVDYELNLRVKNEPENGALMQKNQEILEKLEMIRKRILLIRSSQFYKMLEKAKPVVPPIMKTNIITMQKDYKACYSLWMFISSYTAVGYSVDIADKILPVDSDYYDDLAMLVAISVKTMVDNHALRHQTYRKTQFKKHAKRRYREVREIDYTPTYRNIANFDDKDAINQFYYDKLKQLIMDKDQIKESDLVDTVKIETSFAAFFKTLTKLTNEMYDELIGISKLKAPDEAQSTVQKRQLAYKRQEELAKKYAHLSKLKAQELQATLIRENTQKVKLERLKFEYELEKAKADGKKRRRKPVTEGNKEYTQRRLMVLFDNAERDENVRMEKEKARQVEVLRKEEERLERLRLAREEQKKLREIAKEILKEREAQEAKAQALEAAELARVAALEHGFHDRQKTDDPAAMQRAKNEENQARAAALLLEEQEMLRQEEEARIAAEEERARQEAEAAQAKAERAAQNASGKPTNLQAALLMDAQAKLGALAEQTGEDNPQTALLLDAQRKLEELARQADASAAPAYQPYQSDDEDDQSGDPSDDNKGDTPK